MRHVSEPARRSFANRLRRMATLTHARWLRGHGRQPYRQVVWLMLTTTEHPLVTPSNSSKRVGAGCEDVLLMRLSGLVSQRIEEDVP